MACLLTCCDALDANILGPALLAVLSVGGTIVGMYVVALLSVFPMAGTASASVSMGTGISTVATEWLSWGSAICSEAGAANGGVSMSMGVRVVAAGWLSCGAAMHSETRAAKGNVSMGMGASVVITDWLSWGPTFCSGTLEPKEPVKAAALGAARPILSWTSGDGRIRLTEYRTTLG